MKTLRAALFVLAVIAPALLATADDKAPEGDLGKFQGSWTGLVGPEKNIPMTATIKGKVITLKVNLPSGDEVELKGEVKVDEAGTPHKKLDWTKFTRPDGEAIPDNLALYKFDDKDTITICSGGPGNERPAEFKASEIGEQYPSILKLKRKVD